MKKAIVALCIIPFTAFAVTDEQKQAAMQANYKELKKMGLVTPNDGVQVAPRETILSSDWQKQKELAQTKELKTRGYINETSDRAYELLHFKDVIKQHKSIEAKMSKPNESHMRYAVGDMVMAYTYRGVPEKEMTEFIGIAPVGTYVNEPVTGWSGAVEFFKTKFGSCAFTENNINVSHGAARVSEEDATYEINGKITLVDVIGNQSSGFLYRVNWFDNNFIRNLECANENFSKEFTKNTVELAKEIDKASS